MYFRKMKRIARLFFIDPDKLKNTKYVYLLVSLVLIMLFFSIQVGRDVSLQGDFMVFWQAGKNFTQGVSLYSQIGGAERFIYPPFAAMLFQFLALFPVPVAGAMYCFCNLLMWILIIQFTKRIILHLKPNSTHLNKALLIAWILSFRYFLYHTWFIQMNEIVLLLSLVSVYYFFIKKDHYAIPLLVMAVFIKIIPVFMLIWILSRSSYKNYLRTLMYSLLCLCIPIIWRGFTQGIIDLQEYYHSFLQPFQEGRVEPKLQNYGLAAALYKLFSITKEGAEYHYTLYILSDHTIQLVYKMLIGMLLLFFASMLLSGRIKKRPVSLFEISFVLLFTHLISGITWEYHLVSLYFIIATLSIDFFESKKKRVYYFFFFLLFFNLIIGGDTVGYYLYYKSCGASLLTWLLLLLCIYNIIRYLTASKKSEMIS